MFEIQPEQNYFSLILIILYVGTFSTLLFNFQKYKIKKEIEIQTIHHKIDKLEKINSKKILECKIQNKILEHKLQKKINKIKEKNILNKKYILELKKNILNNTLKINSFINNYSIRNTTSRDNFSIKLNKSEININFDGYTQIETSLLRLIHGIGIKINFKINYSYDNEEGKNIIDEIAIMQPTSTCRSDVYGNRIKVLTWPIITLFNDSRESFMIPIYMMVLLFNSKILSNDGIDITHIYKINFDKFSYDFRYHTDVSDTWDIDKVKKIFE